MTRRWGLRYGAALASALVCLSFLGPSSDVVRADEPTAGLRIVFAALDRDANGVAGGLQQIYTARGDGTDVRRITTPDDGMFYDWPVWAFSGTKIVYTARQGIDPTGEEAVYIMNPDGSGRVKLTDNPWRNGQPKVSPDGRSMVFSSFWSESPELGMYRMDLETLQVEPLTARAGGTFSFESDPSWSPDGSRVFFAYSGGRKPGVPTEPTQIYAMDANGSNARPVTADAFYNTDPSLSPDGRFVAIASYRGEGQPRHTWPPLHPDDIILSDWHLVIHDLATGLERVLTDGLPCNDALQPCEPTDGPAWVAHWSPDGTHVGYLSIRSPILQGIYAVSADGTTSYPVIETGDKAITWWDWTDGRGAPPGLADNIGREAPQSRLLFSGSVFDAAQGDGGAPRLLASGVDRWRSDEVPVGRGLIPEGARWSRDRAQIVFNARVPQATSSPPSHSGARRVHFTLDLLDPLRLALDPPRPRGDVASQQVFIMGADGTDLQQLTTPWTEDALDAIPDGEMRGSIDPDMSSDGRYVAFTNLSGTTSESFILRLDLRTGEVVSLTNMTAGAVPVADSQPRFAPDDSRLAFVSSSPDGSDIFLMDFDGRNVRRLTDDGHVNVHPAWSPDGRWLVYASYRGADSIGGIGDASSLSAGGVPLDDWSLVKIDVATGAASLLTSPGLALRPVWSPDGNSIAFISASPNRQPDIHVIDVDGSDLRPLQVTLLTKETSIDWR